MVKRIALVAGVTWALAACGSSAPSTTVASCAGHIQAQQMDDQAKAKMSYNPVFHPPTATTLAACAGLSQEQFDSAGQHASYLFLTRHYQ